MIAKPWFRLSNDKLLEMRISELPLEIENTPMEALIHRLYEELRKKGLIFQPPCFLADEWFCPVGVPAIGIPFYLAHRRLRKLEKDLILEVEGGSKTEFMKLLRHEAGHAYSYAYQLFKKPKWQRLFGLASQEYTETYRPKPYSKSYVIHLNNWYAQSHPDEDFAETFAVWLSSGKSWRRKYRGWRALEKLEYIDTLMKSLAGREAKVKPDFKPKEYAGLGIKLKTYYKRKQKLYEESYPDFYDQDLNTLFTADREERSDLKAHIYLKRAAPKILKSITFWTKEKKYTIDQLITDFIARTKELNLYVRKNRSDIDIQVTSYITSLVTNHLFTGKFKRSK